MHMLLLGCNMVFCCFRRTCGKCSELYLTKAKIWDSNAASSQNTVSTMGPGLEDSYFIPPYLLLPWPGLLWYRLPPIPMCTQQRGPWRIGDGVFSFAAPSPSHRVSVDGPFFHGVWMVLSSQTHVHMKQPHFPYFWLYSQEGSWVSITQNPSCLFLNF